MYSLIKFLRFEPFDDFFMWNNFIAKDESMQRLHLILESIMLRRTKEEVQNMGSIDKLPTKKIIYFPIELSQDEQTVHDFFMAFSQAAFYRFLELKNEDYDLNSYQEAINSLEQKYRNILERNDIKRHHLTVLLLRLRQVT